MANQSTNISPKRYSAEARFGQAILVGTVFWLSVAGVGPQSWMPAIGIVVLICYSGFLTLTFLAPELRSISPQWALLFGPCLGVGIMQIFVLRALVTHTIFLWLLILGAIAVGATGFRRFRSRSFNISLADDPLTRQIVTRLFDWRVLGAIAILGLVLQHEWWWNAPIIFSSGLAAYALGWAKLRGRYRYLPLVILILMTGSVLLSFSLRDQHWWISSSNDDDPFFVALSHSLVQSGPIVSPIVDAHRGLTAAAYHHLGYFFVGLVDLVTVGDDFLALSRIVPIILAASATASTVLFLKNADQRGNLNQSSNPLMIAAVIVFFSMARIGHPISDFLASGLLIGVAAIATHLVTVQGVFRYLILMSLILSTLTFSKVPYSYAIVTLLAVVALGKPNFRCRAIPPILIGGSFVMLLGAASPTSPGFRFSIFDPYSVGGFANGGHLHRVLALMSVILPFALGLLVALSVVTEIVGTRFKEALSARIVTLSLSSIVVLGILLKVFVGPPDPRVGQYLVQPASIASALLVSQLITRLSTAHARDLFERRGSFSKIVGVTVFLIFLGFLASIAIPELNSGSIFAKSLLIVQNSAFPSVVLLALSTLWLVVGFARTQWRTRSFFESRALRVAIAAVPMFGFSSGFLVNSERFLEKLEDLRSGETEAINSGVVGSVAVREMGYFVRQTTTRDSMMAYAFCKSSDDEANPNTSNCQRPLLLAAYSQRNFLYLNPFFEVWGFVSDIERQDYELSTEMLTRPASAVITDLRLRGVDYLIVDKGRASREWLSNAYESDATVVHENSEMLLLRI